MSKISFIALMSGALASYSANALPILNLNFTALRLPKVISANYDFEGIVKLDDCSGSLIRFENSKDGDPALVLTNGHCLESGFADPGAFTYHAPSERQFDILDPSAETLGQLNAAEVTYSTMTKTDITIYKLDQTYADIESKYSVRALTLSSKHPASGTPIEIVSGYWERGYSCDIEQFVNEVKEGSWTWQDSIRYSRPGCEIVGGTSGSPVIATGTRTVIGINNTTNESGEHCTVNNPCEVDAAGNVSLHKGYGYGEETYWIYGCLNTAGEFDLATPGCSLPH